MNEELAPSGFMRYAPDGHFIFAAFASAFLLKVPVIVSLLPFVALIREQLLRPEFSALLSKPDEEEIFDLIGTLIQKLSSSSIAIDDRHTPKLYARFLPRYWASIGVMARERLSGACRLFLRAAWAVRVTGVAGWAEAAVNTSSSRWPKNKADTNLQVISPPHRSNRRLRSIDQRRRMRQALGRFSLGMILNIIVSNMEWQW